ncbi:MAG: sialidase family protein [Fimbriiglobus sp.]
MFIFEKAPFPSCHASTLVEITKGQYLAAWFGGKAEKAKDVQIWGSRFDGKTWSAPEVWGTEPGFPTWNPVLFRTANKELKLWYKAGPDPQTWTGYVRTSTDEGKTWSKPEILPAGLFGPVRAKPILLADGTILAGTSMEAHRVWTPYVDRSTDHGVTWLRSNAYATKAGEHQIQPTLFVGKNGDVISLMRSRKPLQVCRAVSKDGGKTFGPAEPIDLPNPSAGIDAVMVNGTVWLIHNPTPILRSPLSLAKSTDDGVTFTKVKDLETEPGEYSYPAMILSESGDLAFTYTWRRTHIKFGTYRPG